MVGVRAQRLGSSLGGVFTLGDPPNLHPWLQVVQPGKLAPPVLTFGSQDAEAWLPKRTSAAIVYASKSSRDSTGEGNSGICRVLRLLAEGSASVDLSSVEELVEKVLEQGGDEQTAEVVWRASQSGRLYLPQSTLVRLLEAHERLLAGLVEAFLVEGLQSFEANLGVVSAPDTLALAIGTSRKLYTKALDVLQTHLVNMNFDPRLVHLFQVLTGAVFASASNIPKLFPPRQRDLVILLQAFDDFHSKGQGGKVAEEILCLLTTKSEGGGGEELLKGENDPATATENWSLENRLLLLQFPNVLQHLFSLTH